MALLVSSKRRGMSGLRLDSGRAYTKENRARENKDEQIMKALMSRLLRW
jgi:hypothetical protein